MPVRARGNVSDLARGINPLAAMHGADACAGDGAACLFRDGDHKAEFHDSGVDNAGDGKKTQ